MLTKIGRPRSSASARRPHAKLPALNQRSPAAATPNVELPPASLTSLASGLALQATALLGLFPESVTGKAEKNLPMAKHLIDSLEVLQQKTEGNRTPEETEDIEAMLHQLRMAYVQAVG